MSSSAVEFWFDFASTYSYVAAMLVEDRAAAQGIALAWKPFLLGPLFQRQGWSDSPFNLNPVRGRYMWRDVERLCARAGLAFRKPRVFPRKSVLPARLTLAVQRESWMPELARRVFIANFAEDRDIADAALMREILQALGQDADRWMARALEPDNKEALRRQVEQAWDRGIFGAPTFVVNGELFWGGDRMSQAFEWAKAGPPAPAFASS
jgi:2-hydroxychromene-2-carboxylate isomerase